MTSKKKRKKGALIFCKKKINAYKIIIQNTILNIQRNKLYDIIGANEFNTCMFMLEKNFSALLKIQEDFKKKGVDVIINELQTINNELSMLFKTFGTLKIIDLISVCFGDDFVKNMEQTDKFALIQEFVHPIGYKVMQWKEKTKPLGEKNIAKNRIVEDHMIVENGKMLDCFDLARTSKSFQTKVYGLKVVIHNAKEKKTLIVCGMVDDILIQYPINSFVEERFKSLRENKPSESIFNNSNFERFLNSITMKELMVYSDDELFTKYKGCISKIQSIKKKNISLVVREFLNAELYSQRNTLINLLIYGENPEYQYMAYLLYDLLSNENGKNIDTSEQTLLFDSFPWGTKKNFRDAMQSTMKYTKNLSGFDNAKIPIEQQICLMKATDVVKEKAMRKLKEVKSKSEDTGSKARQYLDGILRLPFGIYRKEPILKKSQEIKENFTKVLNILNSNGWDKYEKKNYTNVEINKICKNLKKKINSIKKKCINDIIDELTKGKRDKLVSTLIFINSIIKKKSIKMHKLRHSGKKIPFIKQQIKSFIQSNNSDNILNELKMITMEKYTDVLSLNYELQNIEDKTTNIKTYLNDIDNVFNDAIYGHDDAKRQLKRIVGQWINGEPVGYCFGFEGPPGVGKTSLAKKGLSNCLKDNEGVCRPFSFIALGGSSNGSTINGHNYTYVGSTWGKIVDILMEKKCLNPIIFIDELDKVSRTEHGKEIIGILTHLIDPTQNDCYQDKYFNGIDLDLSKVLFIFSYNDPYSIDRILLDRIHRIKFNFLSLKEKITISKKHLLPEIYKQFDLENAIHISEDLIEYIINTYTNEAGVRKLKEILFEIVGEINLKILCNNNTTIPLDISEEDLHQVYLKERTKIQIKKIPDEPSIGTINGLWASNTGVGGIVPIESYWYPTNNFLELKLTGMQGDVMKESMNVAKTLAWVLTPDKIKKKWTKKFEATKQQGIHVHCPEGATPKDGPSAGTAITISLFSLLNQKKIKNDIAITGEINLSGNVTAIGGLEIKIIGAIKAGVKEIIYPKENHDAFEKCLEKNDFDNIKFHEVSKIDDVLKLVFI